MNRKSLKHVYSQEYKKHQTLINDKQIAYSSGDRPYQSRTEFIVFSGLFLINVIK